MTINCVENPNAQRRLFWATQPDSFGIRESCGAQCAKPGLKASNGSISTDQWLRGLIINMLFTDARVEDTACGYHPAAVRGHWSETFMQGTVGTRIRQIPISYTIDESTGLLRAYVEETLQKLITRGVANSYNLEVTYLGAARFQIDIEIFGIAGPGERVAIVSQRAANGWIWQDGL